MSDPVWSGVECIYSIIF